jgi:hypothetical protein
MANVFADKLEHSSLLHLEAEQFSTLRLNSSAP